MRKLKISKGKFKIKLPLICFGYGEVGNFAAKFPTKSDGNSKGNFSLKKIAHHPMKTMATKKKPMREYCLWLSTINPSTINKRYQTTKKKDGP